MLNLVSRGIKKTALVSAHGLAPHPDPLPQGEGIAGLALPESRLRRKRLQGTNVSPSPKGRGPGCTRVELDACGSKYDFFDAPLKMIRTIQRELASRWFALRGHAHRRSHEKLLQTCNHLLGGKLAIKQVQQVVLQSVV